MHHDARLEHFVRLTKICPVFLFDVAVSTRL